LRKTIYNRSYVLDFLVASLLVTTIFFLVGQRNNTEQLKQIADYNKNLGIQNQELLQRVKSCTDPDGVCYKSNNTRTAEAVGGINKITIFAVLCGNKIKNPTLDEMYKCIVAMQKTH
jgi:tRNA G18 (ribose-2'-O)-methylase SpoU